MVALDDGCVLVIDGMDALHVPAAPFVALLHARDTGDPVALKRLVEGLLDRGCGEICCAGPDAEVVHDAIDWIVEDKGLQTTTTWHEEPEEAVAYAVLAAWFTVFPVERLTLPGTGNPLWFG